MVVAVMVVEAIEAEALCNSVARLLYRRSVADVEKRKEKECSGICWCNNIRMLYRYYHFYYHYYNVAEYDTTMKA